MTINSILNRKFMRVAPLVILLTLVASFRAFAATASVTLAWNPNTESTLAGYNLYYGTASRAYSGKVSVGSNTTNATVPSLQTGQTYYFAVTATNTAGLESDYSTEVSHTVPVVNTAPVANNQAVSTAEDAVKAIILTGSDAEGNSLSFAVLTTPARGSLTGTAPNLNYTPAANYNGSDSFTFRVNDGTTNSATATVSITVTAVNDAPIANNQSVVTTEDTARAITLTGSDVDGNTLTFAVVAQPTKGTLSGAAPNLTYTPNANATGSDSFTFHANDGAANSATATVSISITAANDAPVANNQSLTTPEDTAKALTLSGSDADGNTLTYSVVSQPTKGTLSGTAPNLTYTPNANSNGSDSFTFKANDGTVDSATAAVSISVTPVNDGPTANNQNVAAVEDTAKSITLSGADADGDSLMFSIVASPTHGTLSGTAPNLTYTPSANYNGSDSFTFRVNDGTTNSNTATVSISVAPVNDTPIASSQSVAAAEDTTKAITLTGSDIDGNLLTHVVLSQPTHGALSGTAPNLTYTPAANYNGTDSFTFRVNDGTTNSSAATVSITVTPVNDAPVADSQNIAASEDTAKAFVLVGSDADGDPLTYTVVNSPSHGTLSGTAPNLIYLPATNYFGSDSFTFRVSDGATNSGLATVTITITAVNQSPVASAQSVTTAEDSAKAITLAGSDPDNNPLTYIIVSSPTHGALSGTAPNVTYTPTANYTGVDSFTFKVSDGKADSTTATVSLSVTAVNDVPVANAQSTSTAEDTIKAITLTGSDVDGDSLTFAVVTAPAHGTLSGVAPNLTYTPAANYTGPDSFSFKVNDGKVDSAPAPVSISVTAVNDAPIASAQSVITAEDNARAITLAGTDTDGNTLTYSIVTAPSHGTLTGTAPNLTYQPATNYNGSDIFSFKVNDGTVDSASALVSITVTAANDAPIADAQAVGTDRNVATAVTLSGSDVDGDVLTFAVVTQPGKGVLSGTAPSLTYTPNSNVTGTDSFTFRVNDGVLNSATATVAINIAQGPNTVPVANAQSATTAEDTSKPITLAGSDADDDALSFAIVFSPTHGTLSGTAPNVTYTPSANYHGTDSFSFKVNDGTTDSATASVSLTVEAINDAPIGNAQSVTTAEDTAKAIILTGSDVDGDALSFTVVTSPTHGALGGSAPNLTYTPAANYNGNDSFTFRVNDGTTNSSTATLSISVTPGNDAPIANNQSVTTTEDTTKAITLTGSDTDGDTLTFIIVTQPAHGTLSGSGANRTYTPAANYNGSDSFTFKVNDGAADSAPATASISVLPANDQPVANAQSATTLEDTPKAITLTGSDSDDDVLTYTVVAAPTHGTLSGSAPNLVYTPATNYHGADSFTFRASDGTTNSATATISITVTPANDAPVAVAQTLSTDEDTATVVTLSASDADGDALAYTIVTPPTRGTLSGTGANLSYTPAPNANGSDSFRFKVSDGTTDSATVAVSISIAAVNDAPTASSQTVSTDRDVARSITLTGSDTDGDALTFSVVTQPTKGVLSGTAPNLTYNPNNNVTGTDSFTFRVNDGSVDSAVATVAVNIAAGPNRAPTAIAQTLTTAEDTAKAVTLTGTDEDGDVLTFTVATLPAHGTLSGTAPNITYTPAANYHGNDSFSYRSSDGSTNSASATVSITVTPVNDAPIAVAQSSTTPEDTAKAITLAGSDEDGDALTYSVVTPPAHGTLIGAPPNLTYTPAANYSGADSFAFKVNDGTVDSATALVSLNVTTVNDAPVADAQDVTTLEDTTKAITLTGKDGDGDALTFVITTPPSHGKLTGTAPNLTYTPATNYNGADTFWFKANDGSVDSALTVVSLDVTAANDAPVAIANTTGTDKNVAQAIVLTGSDVDGDTLTFSVVTQPTKGALSGTAPNLTYTPSYNVTGTDSFTFRANDGTVDSAAATVAINIAPGPNTTPTAIAQSVTAAEDTAKLITLTGSDNDGDTLSYTIVTPPAHGILSGTAPNLTYTPAANYNGDDTFWFGVSDGITSSAPAVISIAVTAANDAPVANAQTIAATAGIATPVILTATDVEGDPLSFTVTTQPGHGTLTGTGANLSYTAADDYSGPDSFTFRANDGSANSPSAIVSINVSPAPNIPPIASAQELTTPEDSATTITLGGTDADGDSLTYSIYAQPAHGTLVGTPPNVTYTPATNFFGADSFSFRVHDGTDYSAAATVSLNVTAVNDAPTLNSIADIVANENSGAQSIGLSGVSAGPGESQTLTITAISSNPGLIPAPSVTYASPSTSGSLSLTPAANATGSAVITVTVNDGQSANNETSRSFTVTVQAVTAPITLDPIADMTIDESTPQQVVSLTGISTTAEVATFSTTSSGSLSPWLQNTLNKLNNKQAVLTVTATSSDTGIVPTPAIAYTSPNDTGTLAFAPASGVSGKSTITVTVADGVNPPTSRSFLVTVVKGNKAPTLDAIANMTLTLNASQQTVALSGITAGVGENQSLTITATSSNPQLIPNPLATYSTPSTTGLLTFTPATDASGSAVITVKVDDGQTIDNLTVRSFIVTVSSENLEPAVALTSPTPGPSYTAPETISLTASVNANGHAISKIQFFANTTLVGEDASAPYSADWNCETAGTYSVVARALYESNGTVDSPSVTITVGASGLPAPWDTLDIGSVAAPGSVVVQQDQFTVQGAGTIEGSDDSFRYVYQPLTADGEILAKIADLPITGSSACAGIMIRENLSSSSPYVFIAKLANGNLQVQTRSSTGGPTTSKILSGGKSASWVRIVRKENLFIAGYGKKLGSWSIASLENVNMAPNIYIGLAVASGDAGTLNKGTFSGPVVNP